jgi:hypothetical protein
MLFVYQSFRGSGRRKFRKPELVPLPEGKSLAFFSDGCLQASESKAYGIQLQSGIGGKTEKAAWQKAALSLGRIVPTEARPSELSGCILGAGDGGVKAKSGSS